MPSTRKKSRKGSNLGIEHFADFSEHNHAKIMARIAEAKDKNKLPEVSGAMGSYMYENTKRS